MKHIKKIPAATLITSAGVYMVEGEDQVYVYGAKCNYWVTLALDQWEEIRNHFEEGVEEDKLGISEDTHLKTIALLTGRTL